MLARVILTVLAVAALVAALPAQAGEIHEAVAAGDVALGGYDAVIWYCGKESVTDTSFTISWITPEPAGAEILYGTEPGNLDGSMDGLQCQMQPVAQPPILGRLQMGLQGLDQRFAVADILDPEQLPDHPPTDLRRIVEQRLSQPNTLGHALGEFLDGAAPGMLQAHHFEELVDALLDRLVAVEGRVEFKAAPTGAWQAAALDGRYCHGTQIRVGMESRASVVLNNDTILRPDCVEELAQLLNSKTMMRRRLIKYINFKSKRKNLK